MKITGWVLSLLFAASLASAAPINVGTLRGTIVQNYSDCPTCMFTTPHGCYLVMTMGSDPVNVHVGVDVTGANDACASDFVEDACVEVTGEIINAYISGPSWASPGNYQLETTTFGVLDSSACE